MNEQMQEWKGRFEGYDVTVVARGGGAWHVDVTISRGEVLWSSLETPMRELKKSYSSAFIALEFGKLWASDAVQGQVRGVRLRRAVAAAPGYALVPG